MSMDQRPLLGQNNPPANDQENLRYNGDYYDQDHYPDYDYHEPTASQSNKLAVIFNITALSMLAYLFLLVGKLDGLMKQTLSYNYLTIPVGIGLVFLTISVVYYIETLKQTIVQPGRQIIGLVTIFTNLLILMFISLMHARVDKSLEIPYTNVFIPLYIMLAVLFYLVCFLVPGFLDKAVREQDDRSQRNCVLMILYYVLVTLTIIFTSLKLDNSIGFSSNVILSLLYVVMVPHLIYLLFDIKNKGFKPIAAEFVAVLGCIIQITLLNINVQKQQGAMSWFAVLSPLLGLALYIQFRSADFLASLLFSKKSQSL